MLSSPTAVFGNRGARPGREFGLVAANGVAFVDRGVKFLQEAIDEVFVGFAWVPVHTHLDLFAVALERGAESVANRACGKLGPHVGFESSDESRL